MANSNLKAFGDFLNKQQGVNNPFDEGQAQNLPLPSAFKQPNNEVLSQSQPQQGFSGAIRNGNAQGGFGNILQGQVKNEWTPQMSVDDYEKRFAMVGVNTKPLTDQNKTNPMANMGRWNSEDSAWENIVNYWSDPTRNLWEKTFNLNDDQNFVFDLLEIIDRPLQAATSAIAALGDEEKNVLEEAFKGLIGANDEMGYEQAIEQAFKNVGEEVDVNPFVGLALDMVLDPSNLMGGGFIKNTAKKGAGAVSKAIKGKKLIDKIDIMSDLNKIVDTTNSAKKLVDTFNDFDNAIRSVKKIDADSGRKIIDKLAEIDFTELADATAQQRVQDVVDWITTHTKEKSIPSQIYDGVKRWVNDTFNPKTWYRDEVVKAADDYGGSLETINRVEQAIIDDVYEDLAGDPELAKIVRMNLEEGLEAGFKKEDAIDMIKDLGTEGETGKNIVFRGTKLNAGDETNARKVLGESLHNFYNNLNELWKEFSGSTEDLFHFTVRNSYAGINNDPKSAIRNGVEIWKDAIDPQQYDQFLDFISNNPRLFNGIDSDMIKVQRYHKSGSIKKYVKDLAKTDPEKAKRVEEIYRKLRNLFDIRLNFQKKYGKPSFREMEGMAGYLPHVMNMNPEDIGKLSNAELAEKIFGRDGVYQSRKYFGSVFEINDMFGYNEATQQGMKLFEDDLLKIMQKSRENLNKSTRTQSLINLVRDSQNATSDGTKFVTRLTDDVAEGGQFVKVNLNDFMGLDKETMADLRKLAGVDPKTNVIGMDKSLYHIMTFGNQAATSNPLLKLYDKFLGLWKGANLMSVGYHGRNITGNTLNAYLSGMPIQEVVRGSAQFFNDKKIYDDLVTKLAGVSDQILKGDLTYNIDEIRKVLGSGITTEQLEGFMRYDDYVRNGLAITSQTKADTQDVLKWWNNNKDPKALKGQGNFIDKALNFNYKLGGTADDAQRYALYTYAKKNKGSVTKMSEILGTDDPVEIVRKVMFDFNKMTPAEQKYMKRLIPFYTWAKNNMMLQTQLFMSAPNRINHINHFIKTSYNTAGLEDDEIPDWIRESGSVSLEGLGKMIGMQKIDKIKDKYLKIGNPTMEAFNLISDPMQSTSPVIDIFRLATSGKVDFPYEKDLQSFETDLGQYGAKFNKEDGLRSVENYARDKAPILTEVVNTLGLSALTRPIYNTESAIKGIMGDETSPIVPSMVAYQNRDKVAEGNQYELLEQLRQLEQFYRQQTGRFLPSMYDLKRYNLIDDANK